MKKSILSMHRWLKRHDFKVCRSGITWRVFDPLDDSGFCVIGSYSQAVSEAYNQLRVDEESVPLVTIHDPRYAPMPHFANML